MTKQHSTIIVGAGISGLYLGAKLTQQGIDVKILESRNRIGGRIYGKNQFDYGPAWFWRENHKFRQLLDELAITSYEQQDTGTGLYQSDKGIQALPQGYTGRSYRVHGGLAAVVDGLMSKLAQHQLVLNTNVTHAARIDDNIQVVSEQRQSYACEHLVLAIPPRLVAQNIAFTPKLPEVFTQELHSVPTWMGSHAKAIIRYKQPFWRNKGLSGTALSALGPLMQIHDASIPDTDDFALFGFIGLSAEQRQRDADHLPEKIISQLANLFGDEARDCVEIEIMDWSQQAHTAARADFQPLNYHPVYGLSTATQWDGNLHFCSTETAQQFGGYLEGALVAAEGAFNAITNK